jgi:hypothetical protein
VNLATISRRIAALAARVPTSVRVPRLALIMAGDPDGDRKCHEAEAVGDPILRVELFDGETQP